MDYTRAKYFSNLIDSGLLEIEENVKIGNGVNFKFSDKPTNIEKITIGIGTEILDYAIIYGGTSIGGRVKISHHVVIEDFCQIGNDTFIGHGTVIKPGTSIGNKCIIGHLNVFEGKTLVGDETLIHSQCHITKGVRIGKGVFIAPCFVGANDPRMCHLRRDIIGYKETPYIIEDYVRIAVAVTVLPGITIKKNSVIGAGAVVTKDVPEREIWLGIPARKIGNVPNEECLE